MGAPTISIDFPEAVPDRAALEKLLLAYYRLMIPKLVARGGPDISAEDVVAEMWEVVDEFLPPNGRIALAHPPDGRLVGCGFMRTCAPGAVEMKRLYVIPEFHGIGLGRRLVEARIAAAREMGLRRVYADTLDGNTPMLRLYDKLGFVPCDRYPGNGNDDALQPFLVYRKLDL